MNTLPEHPLQSEAWGDFRKKTGVKVISVGSDFQMTIHPIPKLPWNIGYIPKCLLPTGSELQKIIQVGKEKKCIFVKLEPNILKEQLNNKAIKQLNKYIVFSPHPLFTKYTFHLDLTQTEETLLKNMKPKTRYNIKIAQRNGVVVEEEMSEEAFNIYLKLSRETWNRQKFFGHTGHYHRLMWETLHPAGIAHLLIAYYKDKPLTAWIVFLYKDTLYYPYGASSTEHKEVMASNLMMWEAIKWGKKQGAKLFDMWGSLGTNPDLKDPWYGFHKFKEGYGGKLVEFVGSYDLVINPVLYQIYNLIYPIRQIFLRFSKN